MTEENTTEEQGNQPPVLYERIVPLSVKLHQDLKMADKMNFSFAVRVNAVPIVMQELPMAVKYFPIVFAGGGSGIMLAVLGIKNEENLFVDDEGNWMENTYIPAYIRRYPFFIARKDKTSNPIICFDDSSTLLSTDGANALFENEEQTDVLKGIVDFTRNFQQHLEASIEFGLMVEEMDMLEEQQISFKTDGVVQAAVSSFKSIKREKFDALDAGALKSWLEKGWVDSTVLHLASGSNFDRLWKIHQQRNA
ncbi:hypothetical protein MNBD_ALPHA01-1207 [hydrothermal vent metagenome]|uniref:SapC family protein n=1 Tax=hydrothermal vent metagenome TaxID=652676 RepID=A0A3B0TFZ2_9ZZZZ